MEALSDEDKQLVKLPGHRDRNVKKKGADSPHTFNFFKKEIMGAYLCA